MVLVDRMLIERRILNGCNANSTRSRIFKRENIMKKLLNNYLPEQYRKLIFVGKGKCQLVSSSLFKVGSVSRNYFVFSKNRKYGKSYGSVS